MTSIPEFEDYCVSEKTGFMLEEPLEQLPEYFDAWNQIGKNVASLLEEHKLRHAVDQMPLLDEGQLKGHRERRLAYMLLSFMGNSYVWQEGDAGVVKMVPQQLAVPWCSVADSLGVKPALSHVCFVLSNCRILEPARNLQTICQLPGDEHAKLFILHTAQVELDAISGLKGILACMRCVVNEDEKGMVAALETIHSSLQQMTSSLTLLSRDVNPDVFYKRIRPFLAGWGGSKSILPEGLVYEGVSTEPEWVIGASAAQSCTLQCFDAALGIKHEPEKQAFLDKMREYMLPQHWAFIEALWQAPSIRQRVKASSNETLQMTYNQCVNAVQTFRMHHIQIVARFIITMSHKWKNEDQYETLSKQGTGGQSLMPFLKTLRDTTSEYTLKE